MKERSENMNKYLLKQDLKQFLDMNNLSNVQEIIINLYKLNNEDRKNMLADKDCILKNRIITLLKNSAFDKYILILENDSLSNFFYRYGRDFISSLDLNSQYDLINENISFDALVNIIPNCSNEVISYFFENDKRALYMFEKFDILSLVRRGIKFSNDILKKTEFFEVLKSTSFMELRKNINVVEKNNNPNFIEEHLDKYYEEIIYHYDTESSMFREYNEILNKIELLFDDSVADTYIVNKDIREKISKYVYFDSENKLKISDFEAASVLLKEETSKKISEIVVDALFRDNIYNVWLNIKEMIRYNEGLLDDEKILSEDKISFYKMILDFDKVSSEEKIILYNKIKNNNFNLEFYNDLRKLKNFAYDKIKKELFNPQNSKKFINREYSKTYDVNIYDLREKEYVMLVRVLSKSFNGVGYHNKDCYSIISNEDNYVIKQDSPDIILYGYSTFDNDMILHMFESDAFSLMHVDNKYVNRIMTSRELVTSNSSYNEVQILNKKRDDAKYLYDILNPDFIVSYDKIKNNEIAESKRLGIPIVLINKVRMKDANSKYNSFDMELDSYYRDEIVKRNTR